MDRSRSGGINLRAVAEMLGYSKRLGRRQQTNETLGFPTEIV